MIDISVRSNVKEIERKLNRLAYQQAPFATAVALTELAKQVQAAEVKNMEAVLDRPTPFTLRSIRIKPALKDMPEAMVFVQDIAAAYLEPYEFGGLNKLNSRALLKPKDVTLNAYGNLPRNLLKRLNGRKDIFIGKVKGKSGKTINGVWQRVPGVGQQRGLKLIVVFADAHPVRQHLNYRAKAKTIVTTNFKAVFGRALAKAIATAGR